MLLTVFKSFLLMSAAGSALTLLLLLLKPLTEKYFGPVWQYYIWLAVLLIMILPVQIPLESTDSFSAETPVSLTNITEQTAEQQKITEQEQTTGIQTTTPQTKPLTATAISKNYLLIPEPLESVNTIKIIGCIWLCGIILTLLIRIKKYIVFKRTLRQNSKTVPNLQQTNCPIPIQQTTLLDAPLLIGLFKPILYLPQTHLNKEELDYILRHELTHQQRHDLLYKWFAMLVCSLHWFNPLTYVIIKQIDEACEISCDYEVTKKLNPQEKTAYMQTILNLLIHSKNTNRFLTTQMASGKKTLQRRFTMIKSMRKTGKIISFISVFAAIMLFSATAFAGGILQNAAADDYKISIYKNEQKISFINQPFVENNTLYVPLREMLNAENVGNQDISYRQGITQFKIRPDRQIADEKQKADFLLNRFNINSQYGYIGGHSEGSTENTTFICNPVLKNGVTYVPYDVIVKLAESPQNIFKNLTADVTDKSGSYPKLNGTQYNSEALNFSLILPLSWCGRYTVQTTDNTVTFLHKPTYEKYGEDFGMLFYIECIGGKATPAEIEGTAGNRTVIMQTAEYTYILGKPTDVQFPLLTDETNGEPHTDPADKELTAEYDSMTPLIDSLTAASIKPLVNITGKDSLTETADTPESVIENFFKCFSKGDFETMKKYCTANCIDSFFGNGFVFGMERAELKKLTRLTGLLPAETYDENTAAFEIKAFIKASPQAVFGDISEHSFFMVCKKQTNGKYLIDSFATGL